MKTVKYNKGGKLKVSSAKKAVPAESFAPKLFEATAAIVFSISVLTT